MLMQIISYTTPQHSIKQNETTNPHKLINVSSLQV